MDMISKIRTREMDSGWVFLVEKPRGMLYGRCLGAGELQMLACRYIV